MKIYIVSCGEYYDRTVDKVFLKKENAQIYCNLYKNYGYEENDIEEYETADDLMAQIQSLIKNEGWTEKMVNEWLNSKEEV